jgi:hypothetical protein
MPCPSHPPWLDHYNYTWKLLIINRVSSHTSVYVFI